MLTHRVPLITRKAHCCPRQRGRTRTNKHARFQSASCYRLKQIERAAVQIHRTIVLDRNLMKRTVRNLACHCIIRGTDYRVYHMSQLASNHHLYAFPAAPKLDINPFTTTTQRCWVICWTCLTMYQECSGMLVFFSLHSNFSQLSLISLSSSVLGSPDTTILYWYIHAIDCLD